MTSTTGYSKRWTAHSFTTDTLAPENLTFFNTVLSRHLHQFIHSLASASLHRNSYQ